MKNAKTLIRLAALTMAGAAMLTFSACGSAGSESQKATGLKEADMSEYINITYDCEYDGFASPYVTIDYEALDELISTEKVVKMIKNHVKNDKDVTKEDKKEAYAELEENGDYYAQFGIYFEIDYELDKEYYSNGDEITFTVSLSDNYPYIGDMTLMELEKAICTKSFGETFTLEVSGLKPLEAVDVDYDQLFTVTYDGFNGYAVPSVKLNDQYLDGLMQSLVFRNRDRFETLKSGSVTSNSAYWLDVELDKDYTKLSNGQQIGVRLKLKGRAAEEGLDLNAIMRDVYVNADDAVHMITVSGLNEADAVVDLFEGLEQYITYAGADGFGEAKLDIPNNTKWEQNGFYFTKLDTWYVNPQISVVYQNKKIGTFSYEIVEGTSLKSGDDVKIKVLGTDFFTNMKVAVAEPKKSYKVPELGTYLSAKDEITDDVLTQVREYAEANIAELTDISGIYYAKFNPGEVCKYNSTSAIVVMAKENLSFWGAKYRCYYLYNVAIRPDGSISVGEKTISSMFNTPEMAADAMPKVMSYEKVN